MKQTTQEKLAKVCERILRVEIQSSNLLEKMHKLDAQKLHLQNKLAAENAAIARAFRP